MLSGSGRGGEGGEGRVRKGTDRQGGRAGSGRGQKRVGGEGWASGIVGDGSGSFGIRGGVAKNNGKEWMAETAA